MSNVNQVYAYLKQLEDAALKSTNPEVQAFGAAVSNTLTALQAAVPSLAAEMVNVGINALAAKEPLFGILVPLEGAIDSFVKPLAQAGENMIIHGVLNVAVPQPQPVA